jgi:hypothetical protein
MSLIVRPPVKRMLGAVEPSFNIEDVHRDVLDELLDGNGVAAFRARNAGDQCTSARAQPSAPRALRNRGVDGAFDCAWILCRVIHASASVSVANLVTVVG